MRTAISFDMTRGKSHGGKILTVIGFACLLSLSSWGAYAEEVLQGNHHGDHDHAMGQPDPSMKIDVPQNKNGLKEKVKIKGPVKEVRMEAFKFGFSPDRIVVHKGDTVRMEVTSRDVEHGLFIKAFSINERIEKGKVTRAEFAANQAGTFEIECSLYCGAGHHKMKAKLIVTE